MNDYIDDTPLTDEEIAAAIAAAKKAKAERAKAQKQRAEKEEMPKKKPAEKPKDDESSESLFDEIDSAYDEEEESLSPKMKSAKSFSNAFAAARSKREESLRKKKAEEQKAAEEEEEEVRQEAVPSRNLEEEVEEEAVFDTSDYEDAEYVKEQSDVYGYDDVEDEYDEASEFEVDDEDEYYTADGEDSEQVEFDGIFQPDDEDTPSYGERVPVDEIESDDDEYDDDEDDDEEGTLSTKAKVAIGIIIAVLVLAIAAAAAYFVLKSDGGNTGTDTDSVSSTTDVTSISFSQDSISLRVGEKAPLNIVIEPETATDKNLGLKTGDSSIATVDEQGYVTGVSSGSTTVTATLKSDQSITASIIINVIDEDQNAINIYNNLINSILDGSTDIDADEDSEEDTESDIETDTETDTEESDEAEDVLTGSLIKDFNDDGSLELALYYTNEDAGSSVRIFYLADDTDEDTDEYSDDEYQYDEYGNIIESEEETDTETDTDTEEETTVTEKILTELSIYSEMYSVCYNAIEMDAASWDTVYVEIKEAESSSVRVTILSDDYTSPTYVYESSDESIATVDSTGSVTAIAPGTCFITVTSPLNSDAKALVKIKVKDDTDLLEDYLAQIPTVNSTNDAVIPTETLIAKKIVDLDGDGVSELLLKFSYGNDVETINLVKVENDQCIVYKTYNNLSDLYDYYDGDGSYSNSILIHTSTGKVCMEYEAVIAKEDSNSKSSEQKIYSVETGGSLSELVNFTTATEISVKTVTSEVTVDNESSDDDNSVSSSDDDTTWYAYESSDDDYTSSDDDYYTSSEDDDYYYDDYTWYGAYAAVSFDDDSDADTDTDVDNDTDTDSTSTSIVRKNTAKTLPQTAGDPYDDDEDNDNDYDDSSSDDQSTATTSTVTSEVTEETTKYYVNGTEVEQSVYEETLSTYSNRYSVWTDWDSV